MAVGRPPKYDNPDDMQAKIDEFFSDPPTNSFVSKNGELINAPCITITGLVLHLGFSDRKSFYEYEQKPEFTHTIKMARTRIENTYETLLQFTNAAGPIFALKNFGWSDKQELDHTSSDGSMTPKHPTYKISNGDN